MMNEEGYTLMIVVVVLVLIGFITANLTASSYANKAHLILGNQSTPATINGFNLKIETLDNHPERQKGLSGRKNFKTNQGLLLVFDQSSFHGIWMKDMNFALDIVWLDDDFRVIDLKTEVMPETYPTIFVPSHPARYILEINAGLAEHYNIKEGDILELSKN